MFWLVMGFLTWIFDEIQSENEICECVRLNASWLEIEIWTWLVTLSEKLTFP